MSSVNEIVLIERLKQSVTDNYLNIMGQVVSNVGVSPLFSVSEMPVYTESMSDQAIKSDEGIFIFCGEQRVNYTDGHAATLVTTYVVNHIALILDRGARATDVGIMREFLKRITNPYLSGINSVADVSFESLETVDLSDVENGNEYFTVTAQLAYKVVG